MSFHLTTNTLLFIIWGLLALSLNPFYCIRMNNWNVLEQSVGTIDLIVDSVLTADKSVISELLWRIQKIKMWKMWGAKCILVMERLLHMNSVVILWQLHLVVFKVNTLSDSLNEFEQERETRLCCCQQWKIRTHFSWGSSWYCFWIRSALRWCLRNVVQCIQSPFKEIITTIGSRNGKREGTVKF